MDVEIIHVTTEALQARRSAIEQSAGKSWPELRDMAKAACCGSVQCGAWKLPDHLRQAAEELDNIAFLLGET